jgi:hypothetical protein
VLGAQFVAELLIQPQSQALGIFKSSGAVLRDACPMMDPHCQELCAAADAADQMDFSTRLGTVANSAIKADIANDKRRVELATWFAFNTEPSDRILGYVAEYAEILRNHETIIQAATIPASGFIRVITGNLRVDVTSLMSTLYKRATIVIVDGEAYNKAVGKKTRQISFGAQKTDILSVLKAAGVPCSGFAQKANVDPEHEAAALAALMAS